MCREVLAVFVLVVGVVLDGGEDSGEVCRAAWMEGAFEDDGFVVFPGAVGAALEVIARLEVVEEGCGEGDAEVMGEGEEGESEGEEHGVADLMFLFYFWLFLCSCGVRAGAAK